MTCSVRLRTLGVLASVGLALAAAQAAPAQMRDVLVVSPVDLGALAAPPIDAFGLETHDTSVPGPCYGVWECNGVDLLAPRGTPVRAPFGGTVVLGTNRVGGRSFLLRSSTGLNEAYGAHMSGFASIQSRTVSAGDVLGYIGTSGNAVGGPPHLHFALATVHAGKWVAVDPYPALMALRHADPGSPSLGVPPDVHELVKVAAVHALGGALRPGDDAIDVSWTGPDDPLVTAELSLTARHQDGGTESDVLRANLAPSGQQRVRIPQGLAPGRYAVRLVTLHDGTRLGSTLSTQRVLIASSGPVTDLTVLVSGTHVRLQWREFIGATRYRIRLWRGRKSDVTFTRQSRIELPVNTVPRDSVSVTPMDGRRTMSQPSSLSRIRS